MINYSILIPVYNKSEYLIKCFESISHQSFCDFEVLVLDDCSSDDSLEIIKKYSEKDTRFKVYHNNENKKISYNRNFLISKATGKYVVFVDPDDYISLELLEKLLPFCDNDVDCIKFDVNYVNKPEKDDKDKYNFMGGEKIMSTDEAFDIFLSNLSKRYAIACSYCIKKEIFDFNNIKYPIEMTIHEDVAVTPIILAHSKNIGFTNYSGYNYVENVDGLSNSHYKNVNKQLHNGDISNKHLKFQQAVMYAIKGSISSPYLSFEKKIRLIEDLSLRGKMNSSEILEEFETTLHIR